EKVSVEVDGKTVFKEVQKCVTKSVPETKLRKVPLDGVKAYGLDRKKVSARQLKKRLGDPTTVLVCEEDQKIDAAYVKLAAPETLVLLLPKPQAHGFGAPAPAPQPLPSPQPAAAPAPAPQPVPAPAPRPAAPAPAPVAQPVPVPAAAPVAPEGAPPAGQPTPPAVAAPGRSAAASLAEPLAATARIADGLLQLRRSVTSTRQSVMTVTLERDGSVSQATSALNYTSRQEQTVAYSALAAKASTKDGEELSAEELAERLADDAPVLLSADGQEIHPNYLKIIRDDAILIRVPLPPPPMPMMNPDMPPPQPDGTPLAPPQANGLGHPCNKLS
ncbi:MAG: hypothetical protein AB7O62_15360, partial [Pirellulales bacterium]